MDRNPQWLDYMDPEFAPLAGDPYFPGIHQEAPADSSDEEDPSEDEVEYNPPEESDDEGILEDAPMEEDNPEGCLTDEEISTPPSSPPRTCCPPHPSHGKCPLLLRTARMSTFPASRLEIFHFGEKTANFPPRFEIGESSRAPSHADTTSPPQGDDLANRIQTLEELSRATISASRATEHRVRRLEEEEKDDTNAIQILYHRMGASRVEATTMSAQLRALEYRAQLSESRHDAAEHRARVAEQELCQLREKFDELYHYLRTRSEK